MTVNELIELLQDCDPEAEVRIMSQESWPFENAISGLAIREQFAQKECECDRVITEPHEQDCPGRRRAAVRARARRQRRVHPRRPAGALRQ